MKYTDFITANADGTFSIPFSDKTYKSMRAANAAASFYINQPDSYIKRLALSKNINSILNIHITYDELYKGQNSQGFIDNRDITSDTPDTAGGGFYTAFSGIWNHMEKGRDSVYRTIGYLFYNRDKIGVNALIDAIGKEIENDTTRFAFDILTHMDEDELDTLLQVYHDNNIEEFDEETENSDLSSLLGL